MSEFSRNVTPEQSPIRETNYLRRVQCALLTAVALLDGALTAAESPQSEYESVPQPNPISATLNPDVSFDDPYPTEIEEPRSDGPCRPEALQRDPRDCADAIRFGNVAIVNYDLPQDIAGQIQEGLIARIPQVTNNTAFVNPKLFQATSSTQAAFDVATGPHNCINIGDNLAYGSTIAENIMPELQDEALVISLSTKPVCDNQTAGFANIDTGNAEVSVNPTDIQAHNLFRTTIEDLSHEYLHLIGVSGHDGEFAHLKEAADRNGVSLATSKETFNLKNQILKATYNEYRRGTLMGIDSNGGGDTLNPLLMAELKWSLAATGEVSWPVHQLDKVGKATVSKTEANNEAYVVAYLDREDTITKKSSEYKTKTTFDKLVIAPVLAYGTQSTEGDIFGISLYLQDTYGNTAHIDNLFPSTSTLATPEKPYDWDISTGQQHYKVRVSGGRMRVKETA